ncbi:hypothetical protein GDO86_010489 [Hymenochirus boettgeri]|uniref:WD repeat and coiled-coil-containing protein n=1 Tax=Hymenochirus boettgeri TaxID=247094 RepID=A0A8T2JQP9_9PIPI|nr:hypothetical protein GDO86_010489 [Hymenochirus boettgeri]
MDLGRAKLLRNGLNTLHQAIHPVHGLVWTDGRQVVLTSIDLDCEDITLGNSVIIGHFEHVYGLFWGPLHENSTFALLAVQHKKHVTIWQLYYNPLEKNKLVVVQTCEVGDPFPVLPQGCVWHPSREILLILTKRDLSLLYSVRSESSSVKADIKSSGAISCACWTEEGSQIVVAIECALYSYIWNDVEKTLTPCSFCPIFDIGAKICAVQPIMKNHVAVTTEMPTGNFNCSIRDPVLDAPTLQSTLLALDNELLMKNRRMSVESRRSEPVGLVSVSTLAPADLSQVLARHRKSDPSPLLHFRQSNCTLKNKQDGSKLVIVSFEYNCTTARKLSIPGISVPDILVVDPHGQRVAVSSSICSLVVICPIANSCLPNVQQIKLEENERPKGLCFLTERTLLISVGKQKLNDALFMPLSVSEKYMIYLTTKELMPLEYHSPLVQDGGPVVSTLGNKGVYDEQNLNKELLMPSNIGLQSPMIQRRLTKSVRSPSCEPSPTSSLSDMDENKMATDSFGALETLEAEQTNTRTLKTDQCKNKRKQYRSFFQKPCSENTCESLHLMENNNAGYNKGEGVSITQNLEKNDTCLWDLQCYPSFMRESLKNCMNTQPSPDDPHYLFIIFQDPTCDGVAEKRAVLLSHGKLHLRTVQEVFHLVCIEMKFGSMWIILTEDGNGFVPITFRHNQEVTIRDAREGGCRRSSCADPMASLEPSSSIPQKE